MALAALAWVEYCNGTGNTYYANMRRKNGREEPYNVGSLSSINNTLANPCIRSSTGPSETRFGVPGKSNR